ncbi:phosphoribosyltransferase [Trujillonella endophytica]|uniref:TRSP domain C terminus to PRTase_2 n=1 Tax=Trujillonella endophytica TaxID=673521 RepID=A0A1H8PJ37_9ACTN|nr:phosphoribosyltransferase [Trujillella endophytica]SEO41781.1 TRSP domain C terminus to PRTase_2 [Trujillella endophytica]
MSGSVPPQEPWTGRWTADRLDAELVSVRGAGGLVAEDLVGMALRRNPRRAHLLVSRVLGKHVPVDPRLVLGAGRLLGALVADALAGADSGIGDDGGKLLAAAVTGGDPAAGGRLLALCDQHRRGAAPPDALVLGYAETATGLGGAVADALLADCLTSTRRSVPGAVPLGAFEESHSHATSHQLLPDDPRVLTAPRPLVLVDDELSTGNTVMDTVRAVQALGPREQYVVATLLDLRSAGDRSRLESFARGLGVRIDVVALVTGEVRLPADVLARGQELVARSAPGEGGGAPAPGRVVPAPAAAGWPDGVRESARHGSTAADRAPFDAAVAAVARGLLPALPARAGARVLVLGTEELMYLPTRIAAELADLLEERGVAVAVSSTTRSPVLPVDAPGYAIRTALAFDSSDSPVDGPGPRFAYNVAAPAGGAPFDAAVLVVDDGGAGGGRLPEVLAGAVAGPVTVVTVPPTPPRPVLPEPLRGPAFGSYAPDEVGWLLTDLSHVPLEAPIEEREEAVQSGVAHYAASLPVEYQPSPEYQELFTRALAEGADTLAQAVGLVTELVLAERGRPPVLVSLARAGTPIGILMRRWAAAVHGLDLPHLAVSIVRGRGIDQVALAWLAAHHAPASVLFVDGWTGKGAITRELSDAVAEANAALGLAPGAGFSDELAVLADPGRCVGLYGTRDDVLIPSACLNSTVSGLVSRTVLNDRLIGPGQFHGAKFYAGLAADDVSGTFLDAVSDRFAAVRERVAADLPALRAADRTPDWAGWRTVERLAQEYDVGAVNLVKPGVGETTRVLLRRVPWRVLVRRDALPALGHVLLLAEQRGVEVEVVDDLTYSCVGIIKPGFTRGGTA